MQDETSFVKCQWFLIDEEISLTDCQSREIHKLLALLSA